MPDFLLELFSEEIPARMQAQAAKELERLTVGMLTDRGFLFEGIKAFGGPRRLTLAISGLPAEQKDVREELKGPRTDAPQAALDGFLKKTGLTKDQLKVETTPKGEVYMAVIERKGRATPLVLAEIIPEVMAKFPWPKSMRWKAGAPVRWVRPLHSILCTFDGEVVPFEFAGIKSGNSTRGHRFLSSGPIEVRRFEDYEAALKKAHVVLDAAERAEIISHEIKQKAFALGLEPIEDIGLLAEVSGLAEWPVVLIGTIQDEFMDVPAEILQTSMRTHQKYFSLRDPKTGKMASRFALVANMVTKDGGKEIVAGNERVLRARLSDAKFFWDEDRKKTLDSRVEKLKDIVFHTSLGTQHQRVERIRDLAGALARAKGFGSIDVELVRCAATISKADLTTGVVGEFPELQGVMGYYYALNDHREPIVAEAIRDHYKPLGPSDVVPRAPTSLLLALADKLDALVSFFAIDERPTGSSDPFALRRAALGVIRIILESGIRVELQSILRIPTLFALVHVNVAQQKLIKGSDEFDVYKEPHKASAALMELARQATLLGEKVQNKRPLETHELAIINGVVSFLADRLKVALKEKGVRHDLIDAVFSLGHEDDLVRLVARVEALQAFLKTDDGTNLLAGYKRAANILKAEEKKEKEPFGTLPWISETAPTEERNLANALENAEGKIRTFVSEEKFTEAMMLMASLRSPVDTFFDKVKVNDDDPKVRKNRLELLSRLRSTLHAVADFSKIEG